MMPMRGALTLGATAQDLVEALVVQLAEKKVRPPLLLDCHALVELFEFKMSFRQLGGSLANGTSSFTVLVTLDGIPLVLSWRGC